uniref:hypothetical protein n=1 Tax=Agathobacter sp. TaxID=2021311 RepID=UPI00405660EA
MENILQKHYILNKKKGIAYEWGSKIANSLSALEVCQTIMGWEWQNRQSKFIANDVRAYEYAGFEWDLPLWDGRLCEYWSKVPYALLYGRTLQYSYMERIIDPIAKLKAEYSYKAPTEKSWKQRIKSMARYANNIRLCLKQHHGTSNAFYNHFSMAEYAKLIWKYGFTMQINSIVADTYISIVKQDIGKRK